jgi:hypothetical protein
MKIKSEWILKGLVESTFVVGSILMALAVDGWSENRGFAEIADQSLGIFQREILQNRARIADVNPYHAGIQDLLGKMRGEAPEAFEVRTVMEGLEVPVLQNTAWQTAVATGALTHMEFEVVSALSLTYSLQDRFAGRETRPRSREPDRGSQEAAVLEALDYLTSLTADESELLGVYNQALEILNAHRGIGHKDPEPTDQPTPFEETHR